MRQTSFENFSCSLARALEVMGDWWTPLVLRDLFVGLRRFDELVEDLGISRNLLAQRLATLVANGIVATKQYSEHARRVEYSLTDAGRELAVILMSLTAWGDRHTPPPGGAPIRFVHKPADAYGRPAAGSRGHTCDPVIVCNTCQQPISGADISFRPGPGGRVGPGTRLIGKGFGAVAPERELGQDGGGGHRV